MAETKALIVGVDGLDYDVVQRLGPELLPHLFSLVSRSVPHKSTFPPDSVPSWTSMITGAPPWEHGQFHSKNYLLDSDDASIVASLSGRQEQCFWSAAPDTARVAIVNPFLAHPAFVSGFRGAMVSGPSFTEGQTSVADPESLLVGTVPGRLGGFTTVPKPTEIEAFAEATLRVAEEQYRYTLHQLESARFDLVFHTNLTVDRIEHFAWRYFDAADPTYPGPGLEHLVVRAYQQLDSFLSNAMELCGSDMRLVVFSDHGHGPRAALGVNLQELLRREGLYTTSGTPLHRRFVEGVKTAVLSHAFQCHADGAAIWLARRMPGKAALKSGSLGRSSRQQRARVPNLGGSNPYGGVATDGSPSVQRDVLHLLNGLHYKGKKVTKYAGLTSELIPEAHESAYYPDILFEFEGQFAPTWNLFGPAVAPIVTRRVLSGGHTRRAVFATTHDVGTVPTDSTSVHAALRAFSAAL